MLFSESPRFPVSVSRGATFGPSYLTRLVELDGGDDVADEAWTAARIVAEVARIALTETQINELITFFRVQMKGRARGFRVQDATDFKVTVSNGRLGATGQTGTFTLAAIGNGTPTYQLGKRYSNAAGNDDRETNKPVSGTVTVYRNASPVTIGAGAGEISIDYTTGIVTFVANDSEAITGHTPGASHVFTTAADIPGLAIGEKVYITGVTGTAAATLNSLAHTISNKTGAGPFTWTLSTATTGLTASGGTAFEYPQATDALTWAGEFDVPMRLASDEMLARIVTYGIYEWTSIRLIEIRV